jgi:stage V sporulation protein D (sporulation-specific penicillin-binding protein)
MRTSRNNRDNNNNHNNRKTVGQVSGKLAITMGLITLALFALVWKLYTIQDENSVEYNKKILSQQRYDSREIPSRRGDITDRNGTYLATSNKVYNLIIDPSQINSDQEDYLEPTVAMLSSVFGYESEDLKNIIYSRPDSQYVRYAKELSYDEKQRFEEEKTKANDAYRKAGDSRRVYGVWFEESYKRYYPNNSLACNVIGFSYGDNTEGSGGIEQYYNDSLMGTSGREYGYLNEDSNLERVIKSATDGNTIVSTIDVNIQTIAEKYIDQWESEMGSKVAAVIVMDPNNGEILAMASNRRYDLNNPRDISAYYTQEELDAMTDKEMGDAWNSIWRNFCISDTYEPGSTSKIFTVAAALEEGSISGSETYLCDGYQDVGGWTIKCSKNTGHGILTVEEGLMQSCNDVMMQIASGLGTEKFCDFMSIFGFGSKTGVDLPGEADTSALVYKAADMGPTDLATNSFGQNYNCTMLQMAAAYCSVINGGTYYVPHVVKQVLNSDGALIEEIEPVQVDQTVSAKTCSFIKKALQRTVEEGTGSAGRIAGYTVGGKTGTAEKYPRELKNYLVSFCGFAPVDDPQVLCYVVVDEPNTEDQAHSSYATNIFKNIVQDILPYMNIFSDEDGIIYPTNDTQETSGQTQTGEEDEGSGSRTETEAADTGSTSSGSSGSGTGSAGRTENSGTGSSGTGSSGTGSSGSASAASQSTSPADTGAVPGQPEPEVKKYDQEEIVETVPSIDGVETVLPGAPPGAETIDAAPVPTLTQ